MIDWFISLGAPTKPSSLFSCLTNKILFCLFVIPWLSQSLFLRASVISLLKLFKTSSTIFIDFLSVTLNPFMKLLLIPASFNFIDILFPPP